MISRFRSELTKKESFEKIFEQTNAQLESKGLIVKTGAIADATVTDSPRKPKSKTTYAVADDRKEDERSEEDIKEETKQNQLIKITQPGADTQKQAG